MNSLEALKKIGRLELSHAEEETDYDWDENPITVGYVDVVDGNIQDLYPEEIAAIKSDLEVLALLKKHMAEDYDYQFKSHRIATDLWEFSDKAKDDYQKIAEWLNREK